jgi:tetraacyldisaccharide 4'-kinase
MKPEELQSALAPALYPVSLLYAALMSLRARAYAKGLLPSRKSGAFCISVGNIAWGGSGKTPLASWLLDWAGRRGHSPALLTRGYGGRTARRPLLVSPATPPEQSGDEALMLALEHPETAVLADPSRRRALDWLEKHRRSDCIILDDAMQHLAVRRDLNLVLLRRRDLYEEWNKVLPCGSWREGATALTRADAFMLRLPPEDFTACALQARRRLQPFDKPVFSFALRPKGLRRLSTPGAPHAAEATVTGAYALCAAVGNPDSVRVSASALLGRAPEREFIFPDHHLFRSEELKACLEAGLPLVCTAKDAVKIAPLLPACGKAAQCFVLETEITFGPALFSSDDFPAWLSARVPLPSA